LSDERSMTQRIAGLDIGDKRIGVAVSDPLGITAQPVGVVQRHSIEKDVAQVSALLAGYTIDRFVAGLPLELSSREGHQAEKVRRFCDALVARTGLEVIYRDERLTTAQSERLLVESGVRRDKRRGVIDKMAAALILQSYLDQTGGEHDGSERS
jgi:putative Holliday junction resolvase